MSHFRSTLPAHPRNALARNRPVSTRTTGNCRWSGSPVPEVHASWPSRLAAALKPFDPVYAGPPGLKPDRLPSRPNGTDRHRVVYGKAVGGRGVFDGRRIINKKKQNIRI